nr:pyruvate formate lyase family protein [Pseudenhygromyxa sp. WMMC2535]
MQLDTGVGAQVQAEIRREDIPALPRLARLRDAVLDAEYGLCTQKAELLTAAMHDHAPMPALTRYLAPLHFAALREALARNLSSGEPATRRQLQASKLLQTLWLRLDERAASEATIVSFARGLAHVLDHAELRIYPDELLVGNPTRHRVGAALHPDYGALLLLPELDSLRTRPVNPLAVSDAQLHVLREDIFPFWFTRSIMSRAPLLADDLELQNKLTEGRRFVLTQFAGISHVTLDFPAVLEHGFEGLREQVRAARAATPARARERRDFYDAAEITIDAVLRFSARWSRYCAAEAARHERLGSREASERAAELRALSQILARVPAKPARTFHEALQSVVTTWVAIHQESFQHGVSFGRVDQYLWPYYARDRAEGRIDPARAVELLGCLLAKASEQLPLFNQLATDFFSGLSSASGLTIGGSDREGAEASNELSALLLIAYDRVRLRQPNVHMRVRPDTPAALRTLACEILAQGGGQPSLFNDQAVIAAIEALGVSEADARDFAVVGCVEWGVPYKSFPAAGAAFISLPAVLLEVLADEQLRAHPRPTMDLLWSRFCARLAETVTEAVRGNDAIEAAHMRFRPTPLLSVVVGGCIESGKDVTAGGAVYDSTGMQGVGLADVADSLAAIEAIVVEGGQLGLGELMTAVDLDFVGHEALRRTLLEKLPKYGQGRGRPERWAKRVAERYCELVRAHQNPRGGPYAPGFWSMTTHVGFGARLGALPSGRQAGRPLANGASPVNGVDDRGPTASLLSAAELAGPHVANGLAVNESLDPQLARGPEGAALIDALDRGYFAAGGMHVQYNVVDIDELLDAKRCPERHRGLVVRISGYSAYFNDLTPAMKDEIITRTLHGRPACQLVSLEEPDPTRTIPSVGVSVDTITQEELRA